MSLEAQTLIELFERTFFQDFNTRLVRGGDEPIYLAPGQPEPFGQIVFAHGYATSALHEIAHWCVAGPARRELEDYGYWYAPDGRSLEQQAEFEQVEVKPQAYEWLFSLAAGIRFNFSADNLALGTGASPEFKQAVYTQAQDFLSQGLNERPRRWLEALAQAANQPLPQVSDLTADFVGRLQ